MSETTGTIDLRSASGTVSQRIRMVRVTVRAPDTQPERHELAQAVIRIGSQDGNDIVVDDESVSRIHCEIVADAHGFRLRDLESMNGTIVDGHRARDVYLLDRSQLVIGRTAVDFEVLQRDAEVLLAERDHFGPLVGRSAPMRQLFALLARVAPTDFTVLIEGETGTGKEVVARAIHEASRRASGPLVVFDAAAVPENLIESLLFGHERGAFTGATDTRVGLLAEAHEGTLFIDELGELPLHLQPKLLRVLETREVCPVGGTTSRPVDVRVVAATHRDLAAAVNAGAFRDDLYYRLAVIRALVPPLRDRREEVQVLAEHFVRARLDGDPGRAAALVASVTQEQWRHLAAQPWPGNVRQLRNAVDVALAMVGDDMTLDFDQPSPARAPSPVAALRVEPSLSAPYIAQRDALLTGFEQAYLRGILEKHGGNVTRAAEAAGLDRAYFRRLLRKHR